MRGKTGYRPKEEAIVALFKMTRQPANLMMKKAAGVPSKKTQGNWILWFLQVQGEARGSREIRDDGKTVVEDKAKVGIGRN